MKAVAIIQARMGSSRLPGKVLMNLAGAPLLARVIDRMRRTPGLDDIVVATTTQPADDHIVEFCSVHDCPVFRGSEDDVLDRYYQAAKSMAAEVIVRATGDNPLIDPEVVQSVIDAFLARQPEMQYAVTKGLPLGLDTEVLRFDALERAHREATTPLEREHVTSHIYNCPSRFAVMNVEYVPDLSHLRWTVDTTEDFQLVNLIFRHFEPAHFSWRQAWQVMEANPDWSRINGHIWQRGAEI